MQQGKGNGKNGDSAAGPAAQISPELREKLSRLTLNVDGKKMTPEERAQAEARAKKAVEEDEAARKALLDSAAAVLGGDAPKPKPKFCTNCGAPVSGGKFCTNCGSPL